MIGATGIFDTDDGSAAGLHFAAARPFAHILTSPDCLPENWGPRHVRYSGYKQSAYLHPDHFTPDPSVLEELGVCPGERYFLVRFVAMHASHDSGETGMTLAAKRTVIERLVRHGRVFLSCETGIPPEWRHLAYSLPADRIHHVLAFADLVVGDSQTMTAEAAVLGTPSLRASSFAGRISYLEELEHRYGLTWGFHPAKEDALLARLDSLLAIDDLRAQIAPGHMQMLEEKVNVARWYSDLIERTGERK
jgi:predicted glycosyltransferase